MWKRNPNKCLTWTIEGFLNQLGNRTMAIIGKWNEVSDARGRMAELTVHLL